jgi:hypothetical protein
LHALFFDHEDDGNVPPKRPLIFNELHVATFQMIELFITYAVTASNPVYMKLFAEAFVD